MGTNKTGGGPGTTRDIHGQLHMKGTATRPGTDAVPAPAAGQLSLLEQARPGIMLGDIRLHDGAMYVPSDSVPGLEHKVRAWAVGSLVQVSCSCETARYRKNKICKHGLKGLRVLEQHGLVKHDKAGWTAQPAASHLLSPGPPPGQPQPGETAARPGVVDLSQAKPDRMVSAGQRWPWPPDPLAKPNPSLWE